MRTKRGRFTVVPGDAGEKTPEIVAGLPPATHKTSGFRKRPNITEYSEGARTTERPLDPSPRAETAVEVAAEVAYTKGRIETLMDPAVAVARLRGMGLDDELGERPILTSVTFQEVIRQKVRSREAIIAALQRNFNFINNWWESENPVERLWGQLNNAFLIIPRWQFVEDLKAVLGEHVEAVRPAGYADENLVVMTLNKEALKQQVYAKLVMEGFPDGEDNKIYTDAELSAIIATKSEIPDAE